jgi:hypothetical protein
MSVECFMFDLYEENVINWLVVVHMRRMSCARWYRRYNKGVYITADDCKIL